MRVKHDILGFAHMGADPFSICSRLGPIRTGPFSFFHFIFNSLDMVAPQIQGSGLQGTMLKTSI